MKLAPKNCSDIVVKWVWEEQWLPKGMIPLKSGLKDAWSIKEIEEKLNLSIP